MSAELAERPQTYTSPKVELLADHFENLRPELGDRAIYLFHADLNESGTFKQNGADYAVSQLDDDIETVVTASAGSHARAVALAAARRGMRAVIGVPRTAPQKKSDGLYEFWNENGGKPGNLQVVKYGDSFNETLQYMETEYSHLPFVHPFNDPDVIKGQGRSMLHLRAAIPDVTAAVLPIGGGGHAAGAHHESGPVTVYGVEADGNDSLSRTLRSNSPVPLKATRQNPLYAGANVVETGSHVVDRLRRDNFDPNHLVTANDAEVLDLAMYYARQGERPGEQLEPTSLLAVAGLMKLLRMNTFSDNDVIAVIATGHNESPLNLVRAYHDRNQRFLGGQIGSN